jgi:hypothetical protein
VLWHKFKNGGRKRPAPASPESPDIFSCPNHCGKNCMNKHNLELHLPVCPKRRLPVAAGCRQSSTCFQEGMGNPRVKEGCSLWQRDSQVFCCHLGTTTHPGDERASGVDGYNHVGGWALRSQPDRRWVTGPPEPDDEAAAKRH